MLPGPSHSQLFVFNVATKGLGPLVLGSPAPGQALGSYFIRWACCRASTRLLVPSWLLRRCNGRTALDCCAWATDADANPNDKRRTTSLAKGCCKSGERSADIP